MEAAVASAQGLQSLGHWRLRAPALAGVVALTGTAAALGATGPGDNPAMSALLRGSIVAAPLGVAAYAAGVDPYRRFARLLAALGLTAFVSTFAETSDPELYALGRTAGWTVEVLFVVALMAFPSGRLASVGDRRLAAAMLAIVVGLYVPALLLAERLKVPSPYTSCTSDCPRNALYLLHGTDLGAPLFAVASLLVVAVMLKVLVRLQHRVATAPPLERRLLVPVLAVGMVHVTLVGVAIVGRDLGGARQAAEVSAWLIAWTLPCLALAFLLGVVQSRLFGEQALRNLATCVRSRPDVPALQRAFADVFDDPDVEVVSPRPAPDDGWIDAHGRPVALDAPGDHRSPYVVRSRSGAPVAALLCDAALAQRPQLLSTAGDLAAVALDNLRLTADAEAATLEARASRARIAAAADRERRRIERDLHDGAQQRLVALRIELSLLEDVARRDPERCAQRIRELEDEVEEALDELRALAHGVCPPLLADRGLTEALQAAASRSVVPVSLRCRRVGRYAPVVETAVYFCVVEALQNVAKHAAGARRVEVALSADGDLLRFSISDDGAGAGDGGLRSGAGITNMRDRMTAVGGELDVRSQPGTGTEVRGCVPVTGQGAVEQLAAQVP